MKKGKLNGKNAEECKAIDWMEFSERVEKNDTPMPKTAKKKKKKAKKDEFAWDVDDVDEDWTIDFDDDGNPIDNRNTLSAEKKENRLNRGKHTEKQTERHTEKQSTKIQDELEDNIVSTTMKEIEEEEILKSGASGETERLKKKKASLSDADAEAIRKSVDDKIIIRSEELKAKRSTKDKARKTLKDSKNAYEKEEERLNKLKEKEEVLMASSRRQTGRYANIGNITDGTDKSSEFRNKSADWRYEGVAKAYTGDAEIERAIENGDFSGRAYKFTFTQTIALVMAIIITAAGVMTTGVYANYRSEVNKAAAYAALPQFEEDISSDEDTNEVPSEGEEYYDVDPELRFEEDIIDSEVVGTSTSLSLVLTSVEKDLKIKLVNGEDMLVKNVPWGVMVTDTKGTEKHYQDEDTDGVIHLTDVSAGDYSVSIEPSEALSAYTFPTLGQEVSVKDKVEYKVIANIKDEIKKESEVDVALEDPNGGMGADVETGSGLVDTVEWVESTKVEQGELYIEAEVDLSKTETIIGVMDRLIAALGNMTGAGIGDFGYKGTLAMISRPPRQVADIFDIIGEGEDDDNDDDDDDTPEDPEKPIGDDDENDPIIEENPGEVRTVTISKSSMELAPGEMQELLLTYTPSNALPDTVTWTTSNSSIVAVNDGYVTGLTNGSARVTATVNGAIIVYCDITVSNQRLSSGVVISGPTSIAVDETALFSAKCSFTDEIVKWESTSTQVLSVTGHGNSCNATGVMSGTAKVKATSKSGASAEITVTVTGGRQQEYDDNAQLYDSQKNKLYVYDNGAYRLAKYYDYKNGTFSSFYKKVGEILYTGWQTIEGLTYYYTSNHERVTGEQIIGGVKYFFDGDGALAQGSGTLGIDVSKYQPSINWDSVKSSGVKYVIIRCGYRGASTGSLIQDPYFVSHIKGAKAVGLKVGVYFFSNALNEYEAVEEASMCAELCSGYGLNYPVFIDVESSTRPGYNSLSVEQRTANIKAFCSTISSAGYTPGLYANKNWLTEKINASSLSCKIWLAQYNSSGPTYTGRYDMWQYTSKGHVDGIDGNVDMDQSYLGY